MKKIFPVILLAAVLLSFNTSYSQISLTVNGGIQLPTGDFGNIVKSGYGFSGSLGFSLPLIPIEIGLTAGYNNWAYKTQFDESNSGVHEFGSGINLYSVPVMVGPKLFIHIPFIGFEPYLGIDAGIDYTSSTASGASSNTYFIYSPIIGFRYNLPLGIVAIDVNVREYNFKNSGGSNQTLSWFGINGGVAISL
jgi:hypothetical protein